MSVSQISYIPYLGVYMTQIAIVPATTLVAGTTYFALRNNTTGSRLFIKKMSLTTSFTGTAAASLSRFDVSRFSAATPTGGAGTIIKCANSFPTSNAISAQTLATGLTTTGVTFESPYHGVAQVSQLGAGVVSNMMLIEPSEWDDIIIGLGEGICIRAGTALVAGVAIHGYIQWAERL